MSLEHSPVRQVGAHPSYWHALIDEHQAADFLGVTVRCLQNWRYRGSELPYVRISARAIRYRRADLKAWADARLRRSTSEA